MKNSSTYITFTTCYDYVSTPSCADLDAHRDVAQAIGCPSQQGTVAGFPGFQYRPTATRPNIILFCGGDKRHDKDRAEREISRNISGTSEMFTRRCFCLTAYAHSRGSSVATDFLPWPPSSWTSICSPVETFR